MGKQSLTTGLEVRLACRQKTLTEPTSGLAPSYLQANLLVLPRRYADDFRLLCARNTVPCTLVAESATPGDATSLKSYLKAPTSPPTNGQTNGALQTAETVLEVAKDVDLRHDFPKYTVYKDGKLAEVVADIEAQWSEDHIGFLIGCSYSFEAALAEAGLPPRHQVQARNCAMYRTTLPLCPAGVFVGGTYVVSMRPYKKTDVEKVRDITRRYVATHGEPIAWGWDALEKLGIKDITKPDWGEYQLRHDGTGTFDEGEEGYVPVFWGCGVTPQNAVVMANLQGTVMAHAPGHMTVLDVRDHEVFPPAQEKA